VRELREDVLHIQGQAEILLTQVRKGQGCQDVASMKKLKSNGWSKEEKTAVYALIITAFMLVSFVAWGWMDTADRLKQKYVCPCFSYFKNATNGYYEAVRVATCPCSLVDIQDAEACSPISDTTCRNVSNDRLVCDELVMESNAGS